MRGRIVVMFGLTLFAASTAGAQSKKGCPPVLVDSIAASDTGQVAPAYLPCQVDREARLRGQKPGVNYMPTNGANGAENCARAEFEFVVDSLGYPDISTVRLGYATNSEYAMAVRATIPELRFDPARLKGARVRQIVQYSQSPRRKPGDSKVPFVIGRVTSDPMPVPTAGSPSRTPPMPRPAC